MEIKLYKVKLPFDTHIWNYAQEEEKQAKALQEAIKKKAELDALGWPTLPEVEHQDHYIFFTRDAEQVLPPEKYLHYLESGLALKLVQTVHVNMDPAQVFQQVSEAYAKGIELPTAGGNTYNNKCEVHMPGNMLATYNQVRLLEDSCTDVLQTALSAGWRIIAVCPQPDSRRPDYILGRFNPNDDFNKDSANRGR